MKTISLRNIIVVIVLFFSNIIISQSVSGDPSNEVKYRRSSLHRILIESDKFPMKEVVMSSYLNAPFPEKYNNHSIKFNTLNAKEYKLTNEERKTFGLKERRKKVPDSLFNGKVKNVEAPFVIEKYFKANKVANELVAKWFNRTENGAFDMNLIADRGQYDATEMRLNIAKNTVRGVEANLSDAGEELINNTFVVVSKMNYVTNEAAALVIYTGALYIADRLGGIKKTIAKAIALKIYNKAREGYSVWTTSYLYKLKWNDTIANTFYSDLWVDKTNIDPLKVAAFNKSDLFEMEFVGEEKARTLVTFSLKKGEAKRPEEQIVERATVRNVNRNYVKLQKAYDVFKTKTPLYSGSPITAKIGMKEGVEPGDKFEVLEQVLDPETGLTRYEVRGTIKAEKKGIWDNRYYAEGEETKRKNSKVDKTSFKGGKNYYAGMLIKQVK